VSASTTTIFGYQGKFPAVLVENKSPAIGGASEVCHFEQA
jgi:hypothetical protein